MFRLGISSLCFASQDFSYLTNFIASLKINLWELVDDGLHFLDDNKINNLLNATSTLNIEFSLHAPYTSVNISATNYKTREFSMKLYRECVEHAHKLGCKNIVFHPGLLDPLTYLFSDLRKPIDDGIYFLLNLGDMCNDYDITPLIENLASDRSIILSINDFKKIFSNSNTLMMALDISHAHLMNIFNDYLSNFCDRIKYFHISSNDGKIDRHWPLNFGSNYWKEYVKRILNAGLGGPLIIENLSINDSLESLTVLRSYIFDELPT
ncbi:MAG: sugar phosphate isomerase/epimerase family protein [Candidatus Methanomethylicia archaeon]